QYGERKRPGACGCASLGSPRSLTLPVLRHRLATYDHNDKELGDKLMKRSRLAIPVFVLAALSLNWLPTTSANGDRFAGKQVTFTKDVALILFKNCAQCHRPDDIAPFSVLSYKEARPWAKSIREKVLSREMPPWGADPHFGEFSNDTRLKQADIDTIVAWVDGG